MKPTFGLLAVLAFAATQAGAAVESVSLKPDFVLPTIPVSLETHAFRRGRVVIVIDVSATGQPTEWLVLGYTHEALIKPCLAAVQQWHFSPARIDGVPVPAQVELTVNFRVDGIVVTSNLLNEMFERSIRGEDDRLIARPCFLRELDRLPARLAAPAPKYAADALRQGVRGKVEVEFYIDAAGAVRMPAVDADAQPYLAEQAIAAIRNWRFEPPVSKGRPVLVAAREEFDFGKSN